MDLPSQTARPTKYVTMTRSGNTVPLGKEEEEPPPPAKQGCGFQVWRTVSCRSGLRLEERGCWHKKPGPTGRAGGWTVGMRGCCALPASPSTWQELAWLMHE